MRYWITLIFSLFFCMQAYAWDGVDAESRTPVEIDREQIFKHGKVVEIHDGRDGKDRYMVIESISGEGLGFGITIEAYDFKTGERRRFEMEN